MGTMGQNRADGRSRGCCDDSSNDKGKYANGAAADVEGVADPDKAFSDMPSRHHLAEDADYQQDQREDIAKFVSHTADGCVPKGYNIF